MEYYKKSDKYNENITVNFKNLRDDTNVILATPAACCHSLSQSGINSLNSDGQVLFVGCGAASDKAISCAELAKQYLKGLKQETRITTKRIEEFWEPKVKGMHTLQVTRELPSIAILLTNPDVRIHDQNSRTSKNGKWVYSFSND